MNVETSKNLGGVGAVLLVVGALAGFANGFAGALDLVGLILVMIAMKGFADHYRESGIFNNALYGVITAIFGVVTVAGVAVVAILNVMAAGFDIRNRIRGRSSSQTSTHSGQSFQALSLESS